MAKIAIVTDSTSDLPLDLALRHQITIVPQVLIWGDETFSDGVDIHPPAFYARLKTDTVTPSTSQATVATFMKIFQALLDQDYAILAILVSAKLSGTINSAVQAKEHLPAGAPIEIVDAQSVSMMLGFNVLRVARAVEQGASLSDAVALAHQIIRHTGVVLTVETLEFLHRGGRIGSASRFMGTALNIKPILEVRDGRVEAVERVRTRSKSLSRVVDLVEEQIGGQRPVHVAALHANAEEDARILLDGICARLKVDEQIFSIVGPVVGTHAGPGTVGLAFLAGI